MLFRSEDFDRQLSQGMIICPHCGSGDVRKVPSAVHLGRPPAAENAPAPRVPASAGGVLHELEALRAAYRRVVAALVAETEDVGSDFANEARRIHYDESPERPIRGQATTKEYESLIDEGIEVVPVPLPKAGSKLN